MSLRHKLLKIVLPFVILAAGLLAMALMIAAREEPQKTALENPGALVEVRPVERTSHQVKVHGTGTVQARREIRLVPQVSGRIVKIAPDLVAGGFFDEGDLLFRIEDADYRLAVDRARAALTRAEYELATVKSQARVASQEWQRLELAEKEQPNPLVLYEPQLKNAKAALESARAELEQAKLDLSRTEIRAPFPCLVRSESVDLGQYLRAGDPAATLTGTEQAEIVVPLPLHELAWLQTPRPGSSRPGSPATIELTANGRTFRWSGRLTRTLGEVDPQGRMPRAVVTVADPYGLQGADKDRPPLAVGTFVEVTLEGAVLEEVAAVPAGALRNGSEVWVMNDSHLRIREVEVLRRTPERVLIGRGLKAGERLVLTNLTGAAEGMKLRPASAAETAAVDSAEEAAQ